MGFGDFKAAPKSEFLNRSAGPLSILWRSRQSPVENRALAFWKSTVRPSKPKCLRECTFPKSSGFKMMDETKASTIFLSIESPPRVMSHHPFGLMKPLENLSESIFREPRGDFLLIYPLFLSSAQESWGEGGGPPFPKARTPQ